MPRLLDPLQLNREVVRLLMDERCLGLSDLQRRTVAVDEEGKGVSLPLLSELLSDTAHRTRTSRRVVRLLALALDIDRPKALVVPEAVAA